MGKYKCYGLNAKFPQKDIPVVQALISIADAIAEADLMSLACLQEREIHLEIVRVYKDEKGNKYKKAQKAAIRADELTDSANRFQQAKLALWEKLARFWGRYSGNKEKGVIIADWLCSSMKIKRIANSTGKDIEFVKKTIIGFAEFLRVVYEYRETLPQEYIDKTLKKIEELRQSE